jgi:hypothetical protein
VITLLQFEGNASTRPLLLLKPGGEVVAQKMLERTTALHQLVHCAVRGKLAVFVKRALLELSCDVEQTLKALMR